ncbi:serine family amino acid catabolism-related protein [Teratosphaeria nubilosa]|uniref:L-serine ammonia-lyase n=1 Tax=Teratosphaeria nubilosa TaxID=161662 RepID=A0A6G1LES4_9PEZI|nr:serine family amino acid catabolism-related protein [Teratosphaeria nubilosa]
MYILSCHHNITSHSNNLTKPLHPPPKMMTTEKRPWIETPLIRSSTLSRKAGCNIYLKLELLQPSGSFKSRGIGNHMLAALPTPPPHSPPPIHFYSSSGGNAGLACVHASRALHHPATIIVPTSTTPHMLTRLRDAGAAAVIPHGASWAEADAYLTREILPAARARGETAVYVPPFDSAEIWSGNSTIVAEVLEQMRGRGEVDAVVCSVGGGGLFCGIMQGLEGRGTKVIAVETEGAESLARSLRAGEVVTLEGVSSVATSLGARRVCDRAFEYARRGAGGRVRSVVLTDREAVRACREFADDERLLVEPACGVCLAVVYAGLLPRLIEGFGPETSVVVVVCGGSNVSLGMMEGYSERYG